MPEFKDLPADFCCPHRNSCPYLEGLSISWVFQRYQKMGGTERQYEYQLEELYRQLDEESWTGSRMGCTRIQTNFSESEQKL